MSGSLLVVETETFRAHHLPDRCLTGAGLTIEDRQTELVEPGFPLKRIAFRGHSGSAAYWFQSPTQITEDYSARVWADLFGGERQWVLVSVLFEGPSNGPSQKEFFLLIHDAIDASLLGGA